MPDLGAVGPVIPAALAGLAAALASSLALSRALESLAARRQARPSRRLAAGEVPRIWRLLLPLGHPVESLVRRSISPRLLAQLAATLRRAGWDESIDASRWLATCLGLSGAIGLLAALTARDWSIGVGIALASGALPWADLRRHATSRERRVERDLPFCLDLLVLALEAGSSLSQALRAVLDRMPAGPLAAELGRLQNDLRAGRSRATAIGAFGTRVDFPGIRPFVAALLQSESTGSSLSAALRAQAQQRLEERFLRAERLAMQAPVKMLGPLILCIFPGTFIVLGFPIAMKLLEP